MPETIKKGIIMEAKNTTEIQNFLKSLVNVATADANKKSEKYQAGKAARAFFEKAQKEFKEQNLTIDDIDNLVLDVFGSQIFTALRG
jgi:hypothetical protein